MHYAAINDRKGIVEILLRSGADPSIPNKAGILPVELAKAAFVRELFLRDRSAIFSPIVQTRMLLTDYIEQMNLGSPSSTSAHIPVVTATDSTCTGVAAVSSSGHSHSHSHSSSAIFNMAEALEDTTPPPTAPKLAVETAGSPARLPRHHSTSLDRCDFNLTFLSCCN